MFIGRHNTTYGVKPTQAESLPAERLAQDAPRRRLENKYLDP